MGSNNDVSCGTYNTNSHIKFKITMLKSSLCYYSDVYTCEWNHKSPKHSKSSSS